MRVPRVPHPVLDRVRASTGLTDSGIARAIGSSPRYLLECRTLGTIPDRHLVAAAAAGVLQIDLHWCFTGETVPTGMPHGQ